MTILTFYLRFGDGECVTAQIQANSNFEDATVVYDGPLERLPLAPQAASAVELRAYLQSFARELGAHFTEKSDSPAAIVETEESGSTF
jgi:hypothetical protein